MKLRLLSIPTFALLALSVTPAAAQTFTDLTVGTQHICAITDESDVVCNTASFATRLAAPIDAPQMIDIAVGEAHSCGISLEGEAFCWGGNDSGTNFGPFDQLNIPAIDRPLVSIAAGNNHSCAIDIDSRVWCWGLNSNQQTQPPGEGLGDHGGGFIKVDAGSNNSCGIQSDGDIACWTDEASRDNGRSRNVPGPFIDLDVAYGNQCGLRADGAIECWINVFDPPGNGPYTDLVVSHSAICGLNQNQNMDCTFSRNVTDEEQALIPVNTQFSSIESGLVGNFLSRFDLAVPFCGITLSGSIECADNTQRRLPLPPGAGDGPGVDFSTIDLSLAAERYSKNSVELFWPIKDRIFMEIYRNDVLVDTTTNNASWFDTTEQTQNPAVYKIRPMDMQGNVGPFSLPVTVDINTGDITYDDGVTNFDFVQPIHSVDSVSVVRSGNRYSVVWTGSMPGLDGLKGYEVRVNNEVVGFNDGFRLRLDSSFESGECNVISVAAMSEQGLIFDYRTTVSNRSSTRRSNCVDGL